jgi:hypothetical protein
MLSKLSQPSGRKGLLARKPIAETVPILLIGLLEPGGADGNFPILLLATILVALNGGYHEPPGMEAALSSR